MNTTLTPRMPAAFIGHGTPMNALETNRYTEAWKNFGSSISRPSAILAISAHWYTRSIGVTAQEKPQTIHDFGGFPQALFDIQYPAPGDPKLALRIRDLLQPLPVQLDHAWGLDHGTWSILIHMFPQADIPVVQLSIDATQSPEFHYDLGKKLTVLRDAGVLVLGAGNIVHNLGLMQRSITARTHEWAQRFNDQVLDHVRRRDHRPLIEYESFGEAARLSVPTPEHYLPILYVLGAQRDDDAVSILVDGIDLGSISMLSFAIGALQRP
jgi:4,5-DOPA dioxygenase extradiol